MPLDDAALAAATGRHESDLRAVLAVPVAPKDRVLGVLVALNPHLGRGASATADGGLRATRSGADDYSGFGGRQQAVLAAAALQLRDKVLPALLTRYVVRTHDAESAKDEEDEEVRHGRNGCNGCNRRVSHGRGGRGGASRA